jgi:dipeptidyl aminopeptidase/acylaminoacyl peptidase
MVAAEGMGFMVGRRFDTLLTRRALIRASAGLAGAALVGCGREPQQQPTRHGNAGASKADGRILFAKVRMTENGGKDDGIYSLDNGTVRKVLSKQDGDDALEYPRWSPDGQRIAFARAGDRGIFSDLWIVNADGSSPRQITEFQSKIAHKNDANAEGNYVIDSGVVLGISWSSGGNFITFASDKGYAALRPWTYESPDQPPTAQNLHVIPATQSFSPANSQINFHIDNTALAPDGSAMAFVGYWAQPDDYSNRQTQISLLDFGTKKYSAPLTTMHWGAYDPAFSPDGQSIAFAARPDYRVDDLFIMARDGQHAVQITQTGAARSPVWSPDGKKIAFLAAFEGAQFNLYVMEVTPPAPGTPFAAANFGKPQKLTDEKGIDARSGLSWAQ